MTLSNTHHLHGLEPDNLLAFLALLGLLRSLEKARPHSHPRVAWSVDDPPIRPILHLSENTDRDSVLTNVSEGLNDLAHSCSFEGYQDISLSPDEGRKFLARARISGGQSSSVWSALISDAVLSRDGKKVEPTPLCLMFGQGHQHFLSRLEAVPKIGSPPPKGVGRKKYTPTEVECLREALFEAWQRTDSTQSFRWDHREDVRYALRATDPTDSKTKEKTQHGANRLAAVGLGVLTVVPQQQRAGRITLSVLGGSRDRRGRFRFSWPIWRHPVSLATIRGMLGRPIMKKSEYEALGVVEHRRATRVSNGKFMNFSVAEAVQPEE